MKTKRNILSLVSLILFNLPGWNQQAEIDVSFNVKHRVQGVDTFKRSTYIDAHSANLDGEWQGDYDKRNYLLSDLDVYFGRETGVTSLEVSLDSNLMPAYGAEVRTDYAQDTSWLPYEFRQQLILCGIAPWIFGQYNFGFNGKYYGRQVGHLLNNCYSTNGSIGQPKPPYYEFVNEPLWELIDQWKLCLTCPQVEQEDAVIDSLFRFHKDAAINARSLSPETKYGGFATAFPFLELDNFERWEHRWKRFIDSCGPYVDFYSVHLYDFPCTQGGLKQFRKGSNNEAILDMITHYNYLKYGNLKPFIISEYGSSPHDLFLQPWSSFRDWQIIKSFNSMMVQFMERPDQILKAIPFSISKGEWGGVPQEPYCWRLMRNLDEPNSFDGEYVWTDVIKFYQLWANVKGTRLATKSSDPDIQVDAYANADKVYLIVNNLDSAKYIINVNTLGLNSHVVEGIQVQHLHIIGLSPVLDTTYFATLPESLILGEEATMIVRFELNQSVTIDQTLNEVKYFANSYKRPISANMNINFKVDSIKLDSDGQAVLRLGLGREHSASKSPKVKVNGHNIDVPNDFRGDNQEDKESFFGMLELNVPYPYLQQQNTITVTFPDNGGFITSLALQVMGLQDGNQFPDPIRLPIPGIAGTDTPSDIESTVQPLLAKAEVYPNPAHNLLYIRNIPEGRYTIRIFNLQGIECLQKEVTLSTHTALIIEEIPAGYYLLSIQNLEFIQSIAILKAE